MRARILALAIAATFVAAPAFAQSASSTAPAASTATAGHYTTGASTIGQMMADPAAKAVLQAHIPQVVNNEGISQASGMTLKAIQSYVPDMTDAVLASIDADLAKLPAH